MEWKQQQAGSWQQRRLQNQLELQSYQLERMMARHHLPAQVSGGTVQGRQVNFNLQDRFLDGVNRLRTIKDEMLTGLGKGTRAVMLPDGLQVQVPQRHVPVPLLPLLDSIDKPTPVTALLGVAEDDRPVLLDFQEPGISNVLISGMTGAGKTALLRTMAVSLALTNRQSQLQCLLLQPETGETEATSLALLDYLPHVLATLIAHLHEAEETVQFLVREMAYRNEQEMNTPTIVVFIDRLVSLLESGSENLRDGMQGLLQAGADVGIHFVLSTSRSEHELLNRPLSAHFPLRLVGQVPDADAARIAAGRGGSQAEYLLGSGDFLAVSDGGATRFQAAFVDDYDLHLCVTELHRRRAPVLLAKPAAQRTHLPQKESEKSPHKQELAFDYDGNAVSLQSEEPEALSEPYELPHSRKKEMLS